MFYGLGTKNWEKDETSGKSGKREQAHPDKG
jgi:hypothetical protein